MVVELVNSCLLLLALPLQRVTVNVNSVFSLNEVGFDCRRGRLHHFEFPSVFKSLRESPTMGSKCVWQALLAGTEELNILNNHV